MTTPAPAVPRKGARRMADIPPAIMADLNAGRIETVSLVEWLAIDHAALLQAALADAGLRDPAGPLARLQTVADAGIMTRTMAIGQGIYDAIAADAKRGPAVLNALATHRCDVVRSWAACAYAADPKPTLAERLTTARRFAADPHMGVRELAWISFRPHLAKELDSGLRLLAPLAHDADPNVRRFASEATRPRGVWSNHIARLKADPHLGEPILEPLRSDHARYVQNSVANWINDASKSRPEWARQICRRWSRESKTPETAYIVRRALRTLTKGAAAEG